MDWAAIGTSAISSGFFSGLVFLWLNHRLTNERNQLEREHQIEMEAMRTELNRVAANQQFQFTKLHERRAVAIIQIHNRMMTIKGFIHQATGHAPGTPEHIAFLELAEKNWEELDKAFVKKMIYFKPNLCNEIGAFIDNGRWLMAHQVGERYRPGGEMTEQERQVYEERDRRWERLQTDSYNLTMRIMNEFRLLLGMTLEELQEDSREEQRRGQAL